MNQNVTTAAVPTETFSEMVRRLFKPMPTKELSVLHAAVGISGEAAEILNAIRKDDEKNFIEEMSDMRFYMEALFQDYGFNYEELTAASLEMGLNGALTDLLVICAGDILDLAKKSWVYGKDMDVLALQGQCTLLVAIYNELVYDANMIDGDITYANQWKLALKPDARYKLGYTDAAAIARADKVGEETEKPNNDGITQAPVPGAFDNLYAAANTSLAKAG